MASSLSSVSLFYAFFPPTFTRDVCEGDSVTQMFSLVGLESAESFRPGDDLGRTPPSMKFEAQSIFVLRFRRLFKRHR